MNRRLVCLMLSAAAMSLASGALAQGLPTPGSAAAFASRSNGSPLVTQLIVKYKDETDASHQSASAQARARSGSAHSGLMLTYKRPMSGLAHVLLLPHAVTRTEAQAVADELSRDAAIDYAVPDEIRRPLAAPNDPYFPEQWNLFSPTEMHYRWGRTTGGTSAHEAWAHSTGTGVVVAVVDTGITAHPDLNANLVNGSPAASGYDFISHRVIANDGDGRDPDPSDPGDWIELGTCEALIGLPAPYAQGLSSWHGTHVSGTIAAIANNGLGVAGVAPGASILTARALGRCGGADSEIIDAMRWAAGMNVPGVPLNTHPARVINLSLGGSTAFGPDSCPASYQAAVADVRSRGVVVVAATGNDGNGFIAAPSSCAGVIAVTAHTVEGDSSAYANVGDSGDSTALRPATNGTTISAPGGGACRQSGSCTGASASSRVLSTCNGGATAPDTSSCGPMYSEFIGTSMAAPHVSAGAALLLAMDPGLTPDLVHALLTASARPFPAGTYCSAGAAGEGKCGAGMLDVYAAVTELARQQPIVNAGRPQTVAAGSSVTLSGAAWASPSTGSSMLTYRWAQIGGSWVALDTPNAAATTFAAPAWADFLMFRLTVADANGRTASSTTTVAVTAMASAGSVSGAGGGGGGGAIGWPALLLLVCLGGMRRGRGPAGRSRGRPMT